MPLINTTPYKKLVQSLKTMLLMHYFYANGTKPIDDAGHTIPSPYEPGSLVRTTEKAYSGTSSLRFNGVANEGLYTTNNALFTYPGDFTLELFFYPREFIQAWLIDFGTGNGISWGSQSLYTMPNGTIGYQATATTTSSSIANDLMGGSYNLNQWNHVAIVRSGNTYSVYLNGLRVITTTNSSAPNAPQNVCIFGNYQQYSVVDFSRTASLNGYMDNIRSTKGVARYTGTSFTVPTGPFGTSVATDPYWNNVSFLLDMESQSADGTPYEQYHNITMTPSRPSYPNQVSTASAGQPGGYFRNGFYKPFQQMFVLPNLDAAHGTGDFTWELRYYHTSFNSNYQTMFSTRPHGSAWPDGLTLGQNNGVLYVYSDKFLIQNGTLAYNTWFHIALVRKNGVFTLYLNGASVGSYSASVYNLTRSKLAVGGNVDGTETSQDPGAQMCEMRISNVARYSGNFTPPSAQFSMD